MNTSVRPRHSSAHGSETFVQNPHGLLAYGALGDLVSGSSYSSSLALNQAQPRSVRGTCVLAVLSARMSLSVIFVWATPSPPAGLCSKAILAGRFSLATLFKIIPFLRYLSFVFLRTGYHHDLIIFTLTFQFVFPTRMEASLKNLQVLDMC